MLVAVAAPLPPARGGIGRRVRLFRIGCHGMLPLGDQFRDLLLPWCSVPAQSRPTINRMSVPRGEVQGSMQALREVPVNAILTILGLFPLRLRKWPFGNG